MDSINYDVDPELRNEFIDEATDGLMGLTELFVELEHDPGNRETVEAIFRVAHSIKGNAAYFELMKTKVLAHEMETLLDLVRKGQLKPSRTVIDVLLAGVDELIAILQRARRGEPELANVALFDALVQRVIAAATGEETGEQDLWQEVLDVLAILAEHQALEGTNLRERAWSALEAARKLAPEAAPAGPAGRAAEPDEAEPLPEPARRLRELVNVPDSVNALPAEAESEIAGILPVLKDLVSGEEATGLIVEGISSFDMFRDTIGVDQVLRQILSDMLDNITAADAWRTPNAEAPEAADAGAAGPAERPQTEGDGGAAGEQPSAAGGERSSAQQSTAKTMRVSEESIDAFLAYVGDLVVIGEMYHHLSVRLEETTGSQTLARELRRVNESFEDLSSNLQRSIMAIRMLPMRNILQRAPRIVRDVAMTKNKEIDTRVVGEDVRADKSLVDALEAPLVHMVRNSADHGIEPPDEREALGKPRVGVVDVIAQETADHVILTVRDDGRGLNLGALTEKAVSMGLIPAGRALTEAEVINLVFASGVSTAQEVSDVSGRGVGMDVVKRNIETMGGRISVKNRPGEGCEFSIQLPRTVSTQILTGFAVVVDERRYILPMDRIISCFRPQTGEVKTVKERGECVLHGGNLVSICRFNAVSGSARKSLEDLCHGILIVVETRLGPVALHVDDIEGVKQVVLKEIEGLIKENGIFVGGAVMGDGTVAMIVDVDRFVEQVH